MSEATRQAALGALGTARAAVSRLSTGRHPEDTAADIIEIWGCVETALRALLDGSPLSGNDLVREVRRREMISLADTHTLLDFLTTRERVNRRSYQPTSEDIEVARAAFNGLERALAAPPAIEAERSVERPPPPVPDAPVVVTRQRLRRPPVWVWALGAVLLAAIVGAAVWYSLAGGDDLRSGRNALREGRREAARAEFERVARQDPSNAEAHLFLARLARDERNYAEARRRAEAAIRAEPQNPLAQREMGAILYALGNYQLAQRFLERAIRLNPDDRTAQGVMGCTLVRLGNREMASRFITRAGPGPWTECLRP